MIKVILKKGRDESLRRFHPWVFSGAIAEIQGNPAEGDMVSVHASDGSLLAYGHYQIGSIAVRVLSFDESALHPDFWEQTISCALQMRVAAGLHGNSDSQTNCYRLIHGEGDNLPGLIIDYYDGVCVMQAHSVGMFRAKKQICDALRSVYGDDLKAVYDKSSGTAPFKAGLELIDGYMYRREGFADDEQTVLENGHKFIVNWTEGQKTGFFLDQRENRALVGSLARGRNVLNLFCYTGGFSCYAMRGGAACVHSVESSAKAIDLVNKNMEMNFPGDTRHEAFAQDAFKFLDQMDKNYDLIILDPPAFAKHRDALRNALQGYKRLNAKAFEKIKSGGILFTFSCSQAVDKEQFRLAVFSAAAMSKRKVRILHQVTQPVDHPINIYHPEGEYLKGLVLYVE